MPANDGRTDAGSRYPEVSAHPSFPELEKEIIQRWEAEKSAIGGLRQVGIPALYVSGYLHPSKEPVTRETVRGESHAWVEWWDGGWHGFDPTNDTEPAERHVVVATGRDYEDVRPLSGIFTGTGTSSMFVDVEVTRLA